MDIFEKGIEDIERLPTLTVLDPATGNYLPFDLTPLTEIIVKVFYHKTLAVLDVYTFSGGTVEEIAPFTDGQIRFVVPATVTRAGKIGKYFYQIQTSEPDVTFPGGVRLRSYSGWCFGLKHSV
jgi:hypothetical protein